MCVLVGALSGHVPLRVLDGCPTLGADASVAPFGGSTECAPLSQGSLRSPWATFRRPFGAQGMVNPEHSHRLGHGQCRRQGESHEKMEA